MELDGVSKVSGTLIKLYGANVDMEELYLRTGADYLKDSLKTSAKSLVSVYVKQQSQGVSQMLWKGIDTPNWTQFKEPRGPRSAVQVVVKELQTINEEIGQVFSQVEEETPVKKQVSSLVPPTKKASDKTQTSAEKKLKPAGTIGFNKSAIMKEILKICMKALLEYVRMKTFGKNGYQQLQVDIYYMKTILCTNGFVEGAANLTDLLLDEITANIAERCLEPVALDQNAILEKMKTI